MKYIITDKNEVVIGANYHKDLARGLQGKVVRAGECEKLKDGWTVFGQSYGYGIKALNSDREYLKENKLI